MASIAVTQQRIPTRQRLQRALAGLAPDAPVVIMLHGLNYDPQNPGTDPFDLIFALNPDTTNPRIVSWPRRLGLRGARALAIGYGWRARGSVWWAYHRAGQTARPLALLLRRIKALDPARPVHIVAHSLGARVALACLPHLPAGSVGRVILIAAAAFECDLRRALASPAGASAEIINIRSRANTLYDLLLRLALPHWGLTLGRGRLRAPNLLDLCIDAPKTRRALGLAGFALPEKAAHICHWSGYLRRDICAFYRALLHRPAATQLHLLQNLLRSADPQPPSAGRPAVGLSGIFANR